MSDSSGRDALRRTFVLSYDELRARLIRRLGSPEFASDALHETWLQIDRAAPAGPVHSPRNYLLRMAFNAAMKKWGAEKRFVTLSDAKSAAGIADEAPDPERASMARSEIEVLARALTELTPRRREILLAARLEGGKLREIASRLDISQRLVEIELKHALAHCAQRLQRDVVQRFGPRPPDHAAVRPIARPEIVKPGGNQPDTIERGPANANRVRERKFDHDR